MKRRLSPFALLCLMGGFAILSSTMSKNPALPLLIRSLGVPLDLVGVIAAASTVVGILVSLPAGALSDMIGKRRVILLAAAVFATAPFLYLVVSTPWQLALVRIYHGLATAILGPVAMAAAAGTVDKGRGERMGWYSSSTMIGRFLAPFAGGALIFGDNFFWVYLVDGIFGTLALVAALRLRMPEPAAGPDLPGRHGWSELRQDAKAIVQHRSIMATAAVEAVQYFGYGFLETFLPIYLNEQAGYTPFEIGLFFTVQIVVAALTKPVMGRLSDRFGRIPMISGGLVLGGVVAGLMPFAHDYVILGLLVGMSGLGLATVTASTGALVADLSRQSRMGTSLGILSSVMDIGHSAGPMLGGVLVSAYAYAPAFGAVGGLLIIAGGAYGMLMHSGRLASRD